MMVDTAALRRRHLRFGWILLTSFAVLGTLLELLHAFKSGLYVDVGSETRRLLWRLAHAHGAGLGLINVAYALSLRELEPRGLGFASGCLLTSSLLVPLGFLLGGVFASAADPGLGVALVPLGAVLLIAGLFAIVRACPRGPSAS